MHSNRALIEIINVEEDQQMTSESRAMPESSPNATMRAWDSHSPSNPQNGASSGKASQFLTLPASPHGDAYSTPTNLRQDGSTMSNDPRYQRAMAAPKKREENSEFKHRAFDPDNMSVRAFQLSPSSETSTENSSEDGYGQNR